QMGRCIGIRIGLKINDKFLRSIRISGPLYTIFYLFTYGGYLTSCIRRKRINIAICTTSITFATITIWTSEITIYNNLKHTLPVILLFQVCPIVVVRFDTVV